ncbi:MAG: HAD-IA family hydrolase [Verrucomicrobia bacterium]|nr:HAD-IA family hydrolase [Verrucomicrobiota bacterium]
MKILFLALLVATSLFAAPQAVVFDFGGVMTQKTKPDKKMIASFVCETLHLSRKEYKQTKKEFRIDPDFWFSYAEQHNLDLPDDWAQQFKSVVKRSIQPNAEMFLLVEELKKSIPVPLLSNIDERLAKLFEEFGFYKSFSPCLLSWELGVEKPNPAIYQRLLDRLNLPAGDVVFIDDKVDNVEKAKEAGLDAILFKSPRQIRQELKKRGLL